MDQEVASESSESSWPELSADLTLARTQARSIMLDTQRANADGRVLELSAQLDLMRTRMTAFEQHLFESQQRVPGDLVDRLEGIDVELRSSMSRLENFSSRITASEEQASTAMQSMATSIESRIDVVETARNAQSTELAEVSRYLEESFVRIAELANVIDIERDGSAAHQQHNSAQFEAFASQIDDVERSVAGLGARIDEATERVEAASIEALAELEEVVNTHGSKIDNLAKQVDDHDEAQDEIASTIQHLQSRAQSLEETQSSQSAEIVDEINAANKRIDQSLNDLGALRSDLVAGESATTEELIGLEEKVDEHAGDLASLVRVVDEVTESFDNRIGHQDSVLGTHSATLANTHKEISGLSEQYSAHDDAISHAQHSADEASATAHRAEEAAHRANDEAGHAHGNISGLTTRVDDHDGYLDALSGQIQGAETVVGELEGRVANLEPAVNSHGEKLTSVNDWVSELEKRTKQTNESATTAHERLDAFNEWVTTVDGRIVDIHEESETTQRQIEAVNDWSATLDGRIVELQEQTGAAQQQIEANNDWSASLDQRTVALEDQSKATSERLAEIADRASTPEDAESSVSNDVVSGLQGRLDEVEPQIDDVKKTATHAKESAAAASKRIDSVEEKTNALKNHASKLESRTDDVSKRTAGLEERSAATEARIEEIAVSKVRSTDTDTVSSGEFDALSKTINMVKPHVETHDQQIEAINDWVTELDVRIATARDEDGVVSEQISALNEWSAELDGRTIDNRTRSEIAQEQIAQLDAQAAGLREQIDSVASHGTALDATVAEVAGLGGETQAQLEATRMQVEALSSQTTNLENHATELNGRVGEIDGRLDQADTALAEMAQKLSFLVERGQSDAGLSEQIAALATANEQLRSQVNDRSQSGDTDALAEKVAAAERSIQDTQAAIQGWIQNFEHSGTLADNELRDFMVDRIDTAEDRIDRRLADIEASGAGNERLSAIERGIAEADERARDAYAFSENLRLLQTDLVQAIQAEMAAHASQVERHEHMLMSNGAPVNGIDPVSRVEAVASQVDEAKQNITQLAELERRHTTVEAQLTETLDQNQQVVAVLRNELDTALQRIAQLEGQLGNSKAPSPESGYVTDAPTSENPRT